VTINLTMIGQMIAFVMFVLFCMRYVWPPLITVLRERQAALAEGLQKAAAAEEKLEEANNAAEVEMAAAKKEASELLAQARSRATQIVEDAKVQASEEAGRIKIGAQAEIDQEITRAREELRGRVGELAVDGAEKILEATIDRSAHQKMLNKLAEQL
jgi:F-type H+-transporting ATPase subunit b